MKYCQLHEENIASETPFAQVAIEYEIEMLPLRYGDAVVGRCLELLGTDILSCLSFITKHIALDGAHTDLNASMLADVIECSPWSVPTLAAAGSSALDAMILQYCESGVGIFIIRSRAELRPRRHYAAHNARTDASRGGVG